MMMNAKGCLIFAANTIGNIEDIPKRSLYLLQTADLLIFEEHKAARQALKAANVHREYLCFSEHKEADVIDALTQALKEGKTVVYMSASGMPNVEDPGRELLEVAYSLGVKVKVIPGPCSITAALAACPFNIKNFYYKGLLAQESAIRMLELKKISELKYPVIILDTPYRKNQLIYDCLKVFGSNRRAFLAVDISGEKEEFIYANLNQIYAKIKNIEKNLNFVLIIDGRK